MSHNKMITKEANQNMRKITLSFMLLLSLMFVTSLASAVTLTETTLNTTISNSSMTFDSIPVTVDQATVYTENIELHNASYTNGELTVGLNTTINWTTVNTNIDSSEWLRITSSSNTQKVFGNSITNTLNGTVSFNVLSCTTVGTITYQSQTLGSGDYSCTGTTATVDLLNIPNGASTLSISYNSAQESICNDSLGALKDFGNLIPLIIIVSIAGIVIFFIVGGAELDIDLGSMAGVLILALIIVSIGAIIITNINAGAVC